MRKLTWKESVLDKIKLICDSEGKFTIKLLLEKNLEMIADTQSVTKSPARTVDSTLRYLEELKIVAKIGPGRWQYFPNTTNENLVYKDRRSMGHIRVTKCLEAYGVDYQEEKTFSDLKHKSYLRYDVYFMALGVQIVIEYDGSQHVNAVDVWGGTEGLTGTELRDKLKNDYCRDNGIILMRVSSKKNVENTLESFFAKLIFSAIYSLGLLPLRTRY